MDIGKEKRYIYVSTQNTYYSKHGTRHNSPPENVHITMSGTFNLGQWIGKEKKYMHFQHKHIYS